MNSFQKSVLCVGLFVLCFLSMTKFVSAHVSQFSGTVEAMMHVNPDDVGFAGVKTDLVFGFHDTKDVFKLNECDCLVTISRNGKEVSRGPIVPSEGFTDVSGTYLITFPEVGIYQVELAAKSKDKKFTDLDFVYDVRVDAPQGGLELSVPEKPLVSPQPNDIKIYIPIVTLILGVGMIVLGLNLRSIKPSKK